MRSTCAKFQFFPWCGFRDIEVQSFPIFPIWLPHHVIDDGIIIIITFYMSRHTYGVNFVSIWRVVAEKNTKVLCGQTNKQTETDGQTDPNAIPSPSARIIKRLHSWFWLLGHSTVHVVIVLRDTFLLLCTTVYWHVDNLPQASLTKVVLHLARRVSVIRYDSKVCYSSFFF